MVRKANLSTKREDALTLSTERENLVGLLTLTPDDYEVRIKPVDLLTESRACYVICFRGDGDTYYRLARFRGFRWHQTARLAAVEFVNDGKRAAVHLDRLRIPLL